MNCTEFDKIISIYLDDALEADAVKSARMHLTDCTMCNGEVVRLQQTRALLKTAVADSAAAVDVSGLWDAVAAELGEVSVAVPHTVRGPSWSERLTAAARDFLDRPDVGYAWRLGVFGGTSAVAAAGLMLVVMRADTPVSEVALSGGASSSRVAMVSSPAQSTVSPAAELASLALRQGSPSDRRTAVKLPTSSKRASYLDSTPVTLAQSRESQRQVRLASSDSRFSKPSRIDARAMEQKVRVESLETSPGSNVSTWVLPGQRTRVIWVDEANSAQGTNVVYSK